MPVETKLTAAEVRRYAADPVAFFNALLIPGAKGVARFGDVMQPFQLERFTSIAPALLALANGQQPPPGTARQFWEATKSSSKDGDIACCLIWVMAFSRLPALHAIVGAADREQADIVRQAISDLLNLNQGLDRVEIQDGKIICEATRSDCIITAADNTAIAGRRCQLTILNELSCITKELYAQSMLDNAIKLPQSLFIAATNSGFLGTWQWKLREIARTSSHWAFHQYDKPAPWISQQDLDDAARRTSDSHFRRLFWGIWSPGSGDAIDEQDLQAALDDSIGPMIGAEVVLSRPRVSGWTYTPPEADGAPPPPPPPRRLNFSFVAGLDLGVKRDHSAIVVLAADHKNEKVRLALVKSWAPDQKTGKVDLEEVERTLADLHQRFQFAAVWFDPWNAEQMNQHLTRHGVPMREMTFTGANLTRMATALIEAFKSRKVQLYRHERLLNDLRRISIVEKSFGGMKLEATRDADGHADIGTAFCIALPAAMELASQQYGPGSSVVCEIDPRSVLGGFENVFSYKQAKQEPYGGYSSR